MSKLYQKTLFLCYLAVTLNSQGLITSKSLSAELRVLCCLIIWFNFYKESSLNLDNISGKEKRKQERLLANQQNLGKKSIAHSDQKKERKRTDIQEKMSDMIK